MSSHDFGVFMWPLLLLLAGAHILGHVFARLGQPRIAGEILAGIVLGPSGLGALIDWSAATLRLTAAPADAKQAVAAGFLYHFGLLLLMFASGYEAKRLFRVEDRRARAWLVSVGTIMPFMFVLAAAPLLPLNLMIGPARHEVSLLLVLGIAAAVTSIPVIARIFHDLGMLHTRFARLVLSVAVVEDIALWAVLGVATSLAASGDVSVSGAFVHAMTTIIFLALGLTMFPWLANQLSSARWNLLAKSVPEAYVLTVLLTYAAVAALVGVNLVFAAFLAGFAMTKSDELQEPMRIVTRLSFAVFVPLYFALVGYQLDLSRTFVLPLIVGVFAAACAVKLLSTVVAARLAAFSWPDALHLAITLNARGGPGIVLASVAFEARIINGEFYTALVLLAVGTSQIAGAWLQRAIRHAEPLTGEVLVLPGLLQR